jgi:hypothetical protein
MAATFSLPQASYPAATRQGIIDTIPGSAVGAQITVTNVGWPAATSVNITVEQSFDNGASWQPWCGSSLAETMGVSINVQAGFVVTNAGIQKPTNVRFSVTNNQTVTTQISGGWT